MIHTLDPGIANPNRVPFSGNYDRQSLEGAALEPRKKRANRKLLARDSTAIAQMVRALYASRQYSVLCIFQALDAAGKDGTIRNVFSGVDPQATRVAAFKAPTEIERRHDMFWRTSTHLPPRGCIGIFNRSYYEEVLVVKVHPEYLGGQYPAGVPELATLWPARYQAIREHEKHLATAGTLVLKFWLQVSAEEQRRRFLSRINEPRKQWKFNPGDVREAGFREQYMEAVVTMLNETSRPWAPWYVIPADDKDAMRAEVASITRAALEGLEPEYPKPDPETLEQLDSFRTQLGA